MSFHSVVPAPRTILRGVRKLPPATLLTLEPDGQRSERQYWSVRMGGDTDTDDMGEEEWRETLIHCLLRAVERRTVSDVPVGVLLSGGLDSSLSWPCWPNWGMRTSAPFPSASKPWAG